MSARHIRAVAAMAAVAAVLAGCSAAGQSAPPPVPSQTPSPLPSRSATAAAPSTPTMTTTPVPFSTGKGPSAVGQAQQQAIAAVTAYYSVLDKLEGGQPHADENDINKVAIAPELPVDVGQINTFREQGWTTRGATVVEKAHVSAVNLSYQPTATPPAYPTVKAAVCLDVSSIHAQDAHSKPVGVANRPNYYNEIVTLKQTQPQSAAALWRVSDVTTTGTPSSCVDQ